MIKESGRQVIIYEPRLRDETYHGIKVERDFQKFTDEVDVIVVNRMDDILRPTKEKIYTFDLFEKDQMF